MSNEPFTLDQSPADAQPVKVFKLDYCTWWAGYSLQQCIEHARSEDGSTCYRDAETIGYEMSADQMQGFTFHPIDGENTSTSFARELQRRIDAGEQFPQLFACTEG